MIAATPKVLMAFDIAGVASSFLPDKIWVDAEEGQKSKKLYMGCRMTRFMLLAMRLALTKNPIPRNCPAANCCKSRRSPTDDRHSDCSGKKHA